MPLSRIVLDIDGVLADFNTAYAELLEMTGGVQIDRTPPWPSKWAWPQEVATPEICASTWHYVENIPEWWEAIPPYDEVIALRDYGTLAALFNNYDVQLVTSRPRIMRDPSEAWIANLLGRYVGVICIEGPKGPFAVALGADIIIDDVEANLVDGPPNRILIHKPWSTNGITLTTALEGLLDAEIRDGRHAG